jgi:hypothetical protein
MSCKLDPAAGVAPAGISSAARCRDFAVCPAVNRLCDLSRKEESDEKVLVRVSPVLLILLQKYCPNYTFFILSR